MSIVMYAPKYTVKVGYVAMAGIVEDNGYFRPDGQRYDFFRVGREVFYDVSDALDRAEVLRQKRLESLRGSIGRVEAMGPFPRLPQHNPGGGTD